NAIHEQRADVGVFFTVDLPGAGGAGDIDFGEVVADDVKAGKENTFFPQNRADAVGNFQIPLAQRLHHTGAASGEIAATLPRCRYAGEAIGHRSAVDHQNALVAVGNLGKVFLRHDGSGAVQGQGFDNDAEIGVPFLDVKNGGAAHAVEGFENNVAVVAEKGFKALGIAAHQHRGAEGGKAGGKDLFIAVAKALGFIDHQRPPLFGGLKNIRGVNILAVERWVFAHQDHIQAFQWPFLRVPEFIPFLGIVKHLE